MQCFSKLTKLIMVVSYIVAYILTILSASECMIVGKNDELRAVLEEIQTTIERQAVIKLKNGSKSGWRFQPDGCTCTYQKVQYVKSGTNYSQIDWLVTFDLGDMEDARYIEYDNHAVVLQVRDGQDLVQTEQVKLYRNYTTTEERFRESSVYIDIRNRADADGLVAAFKRAIDICTNRDR